jgi:hypothetical protein
MNHALERNVSTCHRGARPKPARVLLVLTAAAFAFLFGVKTAAADDHHPSSEEILRTTCLARLQAGTIAIDEYKPFDDSTDLMFLPAKAQGDPCDSYAWAMLPGRYGFLTLAPYYAGTDISMFSAAQNAWDCNHSSVEYAVYALFPGGFQLIQYSILFGNYTNGSCYHDGSGFASAGAPSASLYAHWNVVVAVKSWQHNDPSIGHTGAYCSGNECWWPSFLSIDPTQYSFCSSEWDTCNFTGKREVQFGTSGSYNYGMATNGTPCLNSIFGDPRVGEQKMCSTGLRGYTFCANEWGAPTQCSFSGTKVVAYGARGKYTYGSFTGSVACSNSVFGDPIPGVEKFCFVQN